MSDATREDAARNRGDYLRALEVELEGYVRHGRTDRIKDVQAEIASVKRGAPSGRTAPRDADTDATPKRAEKRTSRKA